MNRHAVQVGDCVSWWREKAFVFVSLCMVILAGGTVQAEEMPGSDAAAVQLVIHLGHGSGLSSAVFSPDGRFIVTASSDHTARLWDTTTGRELRRFEGHTEEVTSAVFAPDGQTILTASRDKTVRLWDVATGRELCRFKGRGDRASYAILVSSAVFSSDGQTILTAGSDGIARLWDIATDRELHRLEGHTEEVTSAVFAPDGRFIVTASSDHTARLWDTTTGRELRRFEGHTEEVTSAVFAPDGQTILTASRDKTARVWDVASGRELHQYKGFTHFDGETDDLSVAVFAPDGQLILTASRRDEGEGTMHLWDVASGRELRQLGGPSSSAVFSPDGRTILTTSRNRTALMWDVATGRELRRFGGDTREVESAVFSPDGLSILVVSERDEGERTGERDMHLWDVASGRELPRYHGYTDSEGRVRADDVFPPVFAPDGRTILIVRGDHTVSLQDVATGQMLRSFARHGTYVNSAVFASDGKFILTASSDYTARLWDTSTGRELRRFEGHIGEVTSAIFSPDGRSILTVSKDGTTRLWDMVTGQELRQFGGPTNGTYSTVFSPDGRMILTGDDTARLWDVTTGRELHRFESHTGALRSAVFSADSHTILTANGHTACLWDVTSGRKVRRFAGHTEWVNSAVFSPDGQFILTASSDHTARLWDATTGQELRHFTGHSGGVTSAIFSPDGHTILTASRDGTTRFWKVQTGQELARLVSFIDSTWVVATPDGRFDSNNLDDITGLHWLMPDDPLRALSPETFMRDYYEPRLLPRVLAGEKLPAIRSLAALNRAQPTVEIVGVEREHDSNGRPGETVSVTVQVFGASHEFGLEKQKRLIETGAYDLRLFRDGQLVAQEPPPGNLVTTVGLSVDEELQQWRQERRVVALNEGPRRIVFTGVRLPRRGVSYFSAYAFNEDRVKSETARTMFAIPHELSNPRVPRAYVVSVGINAFEDDRWDLSFAVNDATKLGQVLTTRLAAQRDTQGQPRYEDVVWVGLTAEARVDQEGHRELTKVQANKEHIAAVLKTLAGQPVKADALQGIEHADKLRRANPEDLVILALSTHGEVDQRGRFYLLPHDIGPHSTEQERRARAISNDDISAWLHGLDSIDLVMIVDACHSAASVQNTEFKPGPMGSRGLGQLAYDKGMRILAATQIDQYALETQTTQQGLLSYALVHEGLTQNKADYKPRDQQIWLSEWLTYASERVPGLYADLRTGKLKARHALPLDEPHENGRSLQQPALFDFARGRDLPLMLGVGQ